jgi:glyoxylase-like metal-dependent hydrolase (beta-lactamase superfamily II)
MRYLTSLLGNSQRLDGGAMFGNAPKAMWEKWCAPDDRNRIALVCRALLIQENNRNILLEAGIGSFFDPKLKERYGVVENEHVLLNSLANVGLTHEDIDIVVLSHLHFDHAGGVLANWQENCLPTLLFPKAHFIVSDVAWQRALQPHSRDRASFIPELNQLLQTSGRLEIITGDHSALLGDDYIFHHSNGHTPGMLLTEVKMPAGPVLFAADLIPGTPWVHVPITMGYDRSPELLIDEKKALLEYLLTKNGRLFFTHDPNTAISLLHKNVQGKFSACECEREIKRMAS